jgi:hypothetical protein
MAFAAGVKLLAKLGRLPRRHLRLLPKLLYYLPCLILAVLDGSPISCGKVSVLLTGRNSFFSALPILPNTAAPASSHCSVTRLFGAWKSFSLQVY